MFPLARFRVEQPSMAPRLDPGDYVIVNRWSYRFRNPAVGDLIVLRDPDREGRFLCKRIDAVTGSGSYLVRGDNAAVSRDSRSFGPIARDLIVGRVWLSARGRRQRRDGTLQSPP